MFIRHCYKEYRNGRGPIGKPRHDPPIKNNYKRLIISKSKTNFEKYGYPEKIISSPFLRTRQTAEIIKENLAQDAEYVIDEEVQEYLGFQKPFGEMADLEEETSRYTQPKLGQENFQNLEKRILNFYEKNKKNNINILIVTHGILIAKLAQHFDLNIDYIKELNGIVIENEKINLI